MSQLTINNITFDYSEVASFQYEESPDVSGEIVLKDGRKINLTQKSIVPDLLKLFSLACEAPRPLPLS